MTTLTESDDRVIRLEDGLTAVRSELADVRVEVERVRSQVADVLVEVERVRSQIASVLVEVERVRSEIALVEARQIRWMVGTMVGLVAATAAIFASAVAILKLLGA